MGLMIVGAGSVAEGTSRSPGVETADWEVRRGGAPYPDDPGTKGGASSDEAPSSWRASAPYLLSAARIIAAFLFIQPGTAKLFGFPAPILPDGGTVRVFSMLGLAGILEAGGGLLLLVGLFTRPTAFVLSGEMAAAYFVAHARQGFWPLLNQGQLAVLFCFFWLYLSAAGPGPWSLDALIQRRTGLRLPT